MKSGIITQNRFIILLLSFLLLIFGNTFTPHVRIVNIVFIYINFFTGLAVFYDLKWLRTIIIAIIAATILLDIFQDSLPLLNVRIIRVSLYLIFFAAVTKEVYIEVLYVNVLFTQSDPLYSV